MNIPTHQTCHRMRLPHWRNALAVLLFGLVALLANLNIEQHRHLHQGVTGQADALPVADVALLLPSQPIFHLLASPDRFGGDDEDKTFFYSGISGAGSHLDLPSNSVAFTTSPPRHYLSAREDYYSPRAPPHS